MGKKKEILKILEEGKKEVEECSKLFDEASRRFDKNVEELMKSF